MVQSGRSWEEAKPLCMWRAGKAPQQRQVCPGPEWTLFWLGGGQTPKRSETGRTPGTHQREGTSRLAEGEVSRRKHADRKVVYQIALIIFSQPIKIIYLLSSYYIQGTVWRGRGRQRHKKERSNLSSGARHKNRKC